MGLKINKTIEINYSADEWQLYSASMNCSKAAKALNKALTDAVNGGLQRNEVQEKVREVMRKYSDFGASDTEPRWVLQDALDEIFGKDEG